MSSTRRETVGVILAGGLARRMGGGDKPMRALAGRPILDHVASRLTPQCDTVILNANGDPSRFAGYDLPVVADTVEDHPGPLAGILAGLEWVAQNRPQAEWVVTAPGDCPFLPRDLVARLHAAQEAERTEIALAASGGRTHPVVGRWNVSMRKELRRLVVEDSLRRVAAWTDLYRCALVEWPADPVDPFFNVNTLDDLAAAERFAALAD